jgi:Ca2+-binding EF-hand superfamily protein
MAFLSDRKKLFTEVNLQEAFDFLDENKNGYIDRRELKRALEGCDKE